jgi:hypothetical protein
MANDEEESVLEKGLKTAGAAVVGAGVGAAVVEVAGLSAIGVLGTGASFGAAAGPVGAVLGGLVFLAGWGVYQAFKG